MPMPTNAAARRVVLALQSAVVLAQAVTAGVMLTAHAGGPLHSAGGYALFGLALVHLLLAVLAWRPGGGPPVTVLVATGFVGVVVAQVYIGIAHLMVLHVPLGVLLFAASVLYLGRLRYGYARHDSADRFSAVTAPSRPNRRTATPSTRSTGT